MPFLIYGAYGYTGQLIARLAKKRGLNPVLAGRDAKKLRPLADELGFAHNAFALDDRAALDAALKETGLVLHCAGPFARTSQPMAEACLRTGAHYLDITGEIGVFEMLAAQDVRALEAGITVLPGVGFDVVPTDCLAAHLKRRVPDAAYLELAIFGLSGVSRGTARTAVENLGEGGAIRREGQIRKVPAAWRTRRVDFGRGPTEVVSIPWGDVATAYHSTDIPNIITYMKVPKTAIRAMKLSRYAGPLLASAPVQKMLQGWIERRPAGPSEKERARGKSFVWGKAMSETGEAAVSRLSGPEGYTFTARSALAAVEKVRAGAAEPGFQTPATAFGPDFALEIEDTRREDVT